MAKSFAMEDQSKAEELVPRNQALLKQIEVLKGGSAASSRSLNALLVTHHRK